MDDVVIFHRPSGRHGCFSNLHLHKPFDFFGEVSSVVSMFIDKPIIKAHFSEKPLMLCKAAAFGDEYTYNKIIEAKTPKEVSKMAKLTSPGLFDDDLWSDFREMYMYEILKIKFGCPRMQKILLDTGDAWIADANENDCIWGIGLSEFDEDSSCPSNWKGQNILGYTLMKVRDEHFRRL